MTKKGRQPERTRPANRPSQAQRRREAWATEAASLGVGEGVRPSIKGRRKKPPGPALKDEIERLSAVEEPINPTETGQLTLTSTSIESASGPTNYVDEAREEARRHSKAAVGVIVNLMNDEEVAPMVRWRSAATIIEIAEKEPGRGKRRLGELTVDELRALALSLRSQEKSIDGEAQVIPDAKPLSSEAQQPDAQSDSPAAEPQAAASTRQRQAID